MSDEQTLALSLRHVGVHYRRRVKTKDKGLWALKDISFDLHKGETLGVIGRNGVGKSTLLRVIADIIAPDRGEVINRVGRASLLSLQVGFVAHLTGRENAILSAMLLGMSRSAAKAKLHDIIEFAGLGDFIDEPVGNYSSGMRVRLGFAVSFHAVPDILLIDEVLGVGDAEFRQKSTAALKARIQSELTVVIVSHNIGTIRELCDRVVWLDGGMTVAQGETENVLDAYQKATDRMGAQSRGDIMIKKMAGTWKDRGKISISQSHCQKGLTTSPIFIFAASWRTGSTLLQRIINASGEVFIWGEPTFLPKARALYTHLQTYLEKVRGNRENAFNDKSGNWIPVVSPEPERSKEAIKLFFEGLYEQETAALGRKRWGFKEVRANAVQHMYFLKEVYPHAWFLFLVRDPYDMYRSLKGKDFHANFKDPFEPVHVWNDNVSQFLADEKIREFCLLVRYEDLVGQSRQEQAVLRKIASHVQIEVQEKMFQELETRTDPSGIKIELTIDEIRGITRIVAETAPHLCYQLR